MVRTALCYYFHLVLFSDITATCTINLLSVLPWGVHFSITALAKNYRIIEAMIFAWSLRRIHSLDSKQHGILEMFFTSLCQMSTSAGKCGEYLKVIAKLVQST